MSAGKASRYFFWQALVVLRGSETRTGHKQLFDGSRADGGRARHPFTSRSTIARDMKVVLPSGYTVRIITTRDATEDDHYAFEACEFAYDVGPKLKGVFHGPRRAAKGDEDALPVWGQGLGPAAELPLGAELYVSAGSAGDLVAGNPANRVFNGAIGALDPAFWRTMNRVPAFIGPRGSLDADPTARMLHLLLATLALWMAAAWSPRYRSLWRASHGYSTRWSRKQVASAHSCCSGSGTSGAPV